MKRVLTFDGVKSERRFEMCRVAVISAGNGKGARDRETIRKEARLLDAFDAISKPAPTPNDPDARVLVEDANRTVTIGQEDHALLASYLDTTPWLPRASRDAVDVQDWVDSADKVD